MSTQEKPLNVRCAESLGWKRCTEQEGCEGWCDPSGERDCESHYDPLPPYGDDTPEGWACTGPLLERFKLELMLCMDTQNRDLWMACINSHEAGYGPTPCAAIADWVVRYSHNSPGVLGS